MEIKNVKLGDRRIKEMYFNAFPKNERMPFSLMVAMSKLWNTEFLAFYDKDIPCGFIYLAKNFRLVFIMFFAVDEKLRSKGYGSEIIKEIQRLFPKKKIIVSIEPCDEICENIELRKRRKAFYLRNGFKETDLNMKLNGTKQEILISNGIFVKSEFISFFAHYSNCTVFPKIFKIKG